MKMILNSTSLIARTNKKLLYAAEVSLDSTDLAKITPWSITLPDSEVHEGDTIEIRVFDYSSEYLEGIGGQMNLNAYYYKPDGRKVGSLLSRLGLNNLNPEYGTIYSVNKKSLTDTTWTYTFQVDDDGGYMQGLDIYTGTPVYAKMSFRVVVNLIQKG